MDINKIVKLLSSGVSAEKAIRLYHIAEQIESRTDDFDESKIKRDKSGRFSTKSEGKESKESESKSESGSSYTGELPEMTSAAWSKLPPTHFDNVVIGKDASGKPMTVASVQADRDRLLKNIGTGFNESMFVDGNGDPLPPCRRRLHEAIILSAFDGIKKAKPGEQTQTFMGGGPGVGKSTVLNSGKLTGFPAHDEAVFVEADAYKGMLPEYQEAMEKGDMEAKEAATAGTHDESIQLTKHINHLAQQNGYSCVLDGTGDSGTKKMGGKIEAARKAGMKVKAVYVTCDITQTLVRAAGRAAETGRSIPYDIVVAKNIDAPRTLSALASQFDEISLYDTSNDTNGNPQLVATGGSGKGLQSADQTRFSAFEQRRDSNPAQYESTVEKIKGFMHSMPRKDFLTFCRSNEILRHL